MNVYLGISPTRYAYGRVQCDAYHGGLEPPLATVDLGRRSRVVGIVDQVRFLCDGCARGRTRGWRDTRRIVGSPEAAA